MQSFEIKTTMSKNIISTLNAAKAATNFKLAESLQPILQPQSTTGPKSVLYDLFGRKHNYLRVSLTERCNLRCNFNLKNKQNNSFIFL